MVKGNNVCTVCSVLVVGHPPSFDIVEDEATLTSSRCRSCRRHITPASHYFPRLPREAATIATAVHVIGPLIRSHALRTVDHNQHGRVLYGGCWLVEAKKFEFKKQKLPCRKPLAPLNSLQQVVQVPDRPISAPAYVSPT